MVVAALALAGIGAAAQGYSAYQQVQAQNRSNEFNAAIMKRNQKLFEEQALFAEKKGGTKEAQFRIGLEHLKGEQRASFSTSGVVVGEGSAGRIVDDTAAFGELDAMTIRRNTEFEAFDLRARGSQDAARGNLFEASNSSASGAAAIALLGGGSRIATTYANSKRG